MRDTFPRMWVKLSKRHGVVFCGHVESFVKNLRSHARKSTQEPWFDVKIWYEIT